MNTSVYLNEKYINLLELLLKLRVVGATRHKISHAAMMAGMRGVGAYNIPSHWIHLPVIGTYAEYIEIVPVRKRNGEKV